LTAAPLPSQIIVYRPAETRLGEVDDHGWHATNCLASTRAGDRALIYQSGGDAGVVSVFDFARDAHPHADLGFAAWGRSTVLPQMVTRKQLMADPRTSPVFRHIQGRRSLPADAALAIVNMAGGLPHVGGSDEPPPAADETWRFYPADLGSTWGNEASMQLAIAGNPAPGVASASRSSRRWSS
jgi:hypothetical protein